MSEKINWDKVHEELEEKGTFDVYTTPYDFNHTIPVDDKYNYLPKNFFFNLYSGFLRFIMIALSPIVNFCAFNLRVYGRKNLKKVKKQGYFTVMNHCSYLDSLILRQVLRFKKSYLTVAPHNCKSGFAGITLRAGGTIPIPEKLSAMKNFKNAIHTIIDKKGVVQFYAEKAMWMHYPKPRPFKKGAFSYAVTENAPIVPIYIRWTKSKGIRKAFGFKDDATVIVLDPIYPKEGLSQRDNTIYLQHETQKAFAEEYRRYFNISTEEKPCIYDINEEYLDNLDPETKFAASL